MRNRYLSLLALALVAIECGCTSLPKPDPSFEASRFPSSQDYVSQALLLLKKMPKSSAVSRILCYREDLVVGVYGTETVDQDGEYTVAQGDFNQFPREKGMATQTLSKNRVSYSSANYTLTGPLNTLLNETRHSRQLAKEGKISFSLHAGMINGEPVPCIIENKL